MTISMNLLIVLSVALGFHALSHQRGNPVSYTHLDVYKRQTPPQAAEAVPQSCGGVVGKVILRFLHLQGIRRQARLLLPRHRPAPRCV